MPGEQPGSQGAGTRETPLPPAGKIAPQLFCFHPPVRAAEPGVGMPVCGPGCSWGAGCGGDSSALGRGGGVRAEIASLLGARRALTVHVQSPRARHGAGAGSEAGLYPQPLDPRHRGRGGPGERGEADPAGGSGWARLPELLPSSAGPEDGSQRVLGQGGSSPGFSNSQL